MHTFSGASLLILPLFSYPTSGVTFAVTGIEAEDLGVAIWTEARFVTGSTTPANLTTVLTMSLTKLVPLASHLEGLSFPYLVRACGFVPSADILTSLTAPHAHTYPLPPASFT